MTEITTAGSAIPAVLGALDDAPPVNTTVKGSAAHSTTRRVAAVPGRMVALNFKVPCEFRRHLKVLAAQRGISMTALLKRALECLVSCEMHDRAEFQSTRRHADLTQTR